MVVEGERLLRDDDGVELWSARFGRSDAGLVVLLAGAAMSSQIWDTGLRAELVSAGLSVLTVDWRDTGRSTWRRFRDHPYGFDRLRHRRPDVPDRTRTRIGENDSRG